MIQVAETVEPSVDVAAADGPAGGLAGAGHLFGHFDGVDATEPADGATVAPAVDKAAEAAAARERVAARARASVIRPQAVEEKDTDPRPQTNFFDQFDSDPDAGEVTLEERMRLSAKDGYYRGTIAGAAELRSLVQAGQDSGWSDDIKQRYENIVADLTRHDMLRPPSTPAEAAAMLAGQTMVGAPHAIAEASHSPPASDERPTPYVAELFARNAPTLAAPQQPQWPNRFQNVPEDPFERAAQTTKRAVQGDRGPGRSGSAEFVTGLYNYADDLSRRMFEASENRRLGGDFNPKPFVEFAGNMFGIGGPYAMLAKPGVGVLGGRMRPPPSDLGAITPEISVAIGREAAPIRVSADRLTHIDDTHGQQLRQAGYANAQALVTDVARNFNAIYPSGQPGGLFIVKHNGVAKIAVIELKAAEDGAQWAVWTAGVYRSDFFANKKKLWSRPGPEGSSPP